MTLTWFEFDFQRVLQKNSITITYPRKKPPDWVASLGDYDEKSFRISLNKVRRSLFNGYIILDQS